ncbi:hypothetical protein SAMN04488082_12224 [Desulfomicrobium apsheronum]|uniref:Uncharacterized protein n=1 Tax=Desulfomicrobium apsheronum TaxID=52560 RepID=A0A1I3Z4E7_9BACT|nr:hypothetical protein SAMN04488082_12224 [Desulfomicrobium apsheronum]
MIQNAAGQIWLAVFKDAFMTAQNTILVDSRPPRSVQ